MTTTLCNSGDVTFKAGRNAYNTIADSVWTSAINQAEGELSVIANVDLVANSGEITSIGKQFLKKMCASIAGMEIINNDMSGFTSRQEAETMLDVLNSQINRGMSKLKTDNTKTWLGI